MSANHAALSEGLGKGKKSLDDFGEAAKGVGNKVKEGFAIGAGIEAFRLSFDLVKESIHAVIDTAKEWVSTALEAGNASLRTAQALHIHTDTLGALQGAARKAGVDSEQFTMALEKLNAKIGEAALKGGESAEVFQRLGLSARKMSGQGLDKNIAQISDALAKIKNPAEQAAVAAELFGERLGGKLIPVLGQGSAAIQEYIQHARETGTALSDIDTAKLAGAQRIFGEMGERVEAVKNQLAIALAPALSAIGEKILSLLPSADKMKEGFNSAALAIAKGIGWVIDTYNTLKGAILIVASGGVAALGGLIGIVNKLAEGILWVTNKIFGTNYEAPAFLAESMNAVNQWSEEIKQMGLDAWNQPSAVAKAEAFFKSIQTAADNNAKALIEHKDDLKPIVQGIEDYRKEIEKTLADMAKEIGTFGQTEGQKKLFDLEAMGANKDQLELAQQYVDELKRLEDKKKEAADATELIKQITDKNPLTKYQSEMEKLDKLHKDGLLNAQQYAAGVAEANKGLQDALKHDATEKKIGAEVRRFDFKGPAKSPDMADPIKQLAKTAEKQAKDVERSKFYLQEIYRYQMNADNNADITVDF